MSNNSDRYTQPTEFAPIVLFAYNRPQHTRRLLESLAACDGASQSELYIYCDGPRRPEDLEAVKAVRTVAKAQPWCGTVHVVEREANLGLAQSVITGVSEIVERCGAVIVLEDDLILSPHFLTYMNAALKTYWHVPQVMHIAGYMYPVTQTLPSETFFLRLGTCWGWATWHRAWAHFNVDGKALRAQIHHEGLVDTFNLGGAINYDRMLRDQIEGRNNSWAVRWYASMVTAGGLGLHPAISLVQNDGFDGSGNHCPEMSDYHAVLAVHSPNITALELCEDSVAVKAVRHFYKRKDRLINKIKRRLRLIRRSGLGALVPAGHLFK